MKYFEYEKAFSQARLNKYYNACSGNTTKALTLYRYNIKLCQKFYGILNIFEIVLRNAINDHYKSVFSDSDWIKNQLRRGGMLENIPQKNEVLRAQKAASSSPAQPSWHYLPHCKMPDLQL